MKVTIIGGSSFIGKNLIEQSPKNWIVKATYCNAKNFNEFADEHNIEAVKVDLVENTIPNTSFGNLSAVLGVRDNPPASYK